MNARPLLFLIAALAAGCGGGGQSSVGGLRLSLAWPKSRVIPTAAQSVRVQVLQGAAVVNEAILTPASPTTSFTEIPAGSVTVRAVAYPASNGTGTAMASAQVPATIVANGTASVDLTMASTIDRLTISPSPVVLQLSGVFVRQLVVTAYDASNSVVLTSASDLSYASSSGTLFTVNASGLVQAVGGAGTGTVTATDAISGKSATATVHVIP